MIEAMRVRVMMATGLGIALTCASAALADAVATNGGATQVTATSAVLTGTVNTSDVDSAWYFRYGTTAGYGAITKVNVIGAVNQRVSVEVAGLDPGTTYHFQLVVAEGSYPITYHLSDDGTFETAGNGGGGPGTSYGNASLKSHRLRVRGGAVRIAFRCSGASGASCHGHVKISARGRVNGHMKTVGCGSGTLSTSGGRTQVVTGSVSKGCKALLHSARHHHLRATLKATYSTHESSLKTHVTLLG
jgi:hypothetical protein